MQPVQELPANYKKVGAIDITKDRRLLVLLNLLAVIGLVIAGWFFLRATAWLRPGALERLSFNMSSLTDVMALLAAAIVLLALHVILHEAIHGFFFWIFTRSRPQFAFRLTHAYAAAPDWYIPRNAYLVTSLAPLVLISLGALVLLRFAPATWFLPIWFVATMNAAGSVGDIGVAAWLLLQPPTCLANDKGDAVTLYKPG